MEPTVAGLLAGSAKSFKFEKPGDTITGIITDLQARQRTDFSSGKPLTFDSGEPQMQIVVTLVTDLHDPSPDDDGSRSVYIKAWGDQKRALIAACRTIGRDLAIGDTFTATYAGDGQQPAQGGYAPKLYRYSLTAGSPVSEVLSASQTAAGTEAPFTSEAHQAAKRLKGLNMMSDEQIAAATGLTVEQVAGL